MGRPPRGGDADQARPGAPDGGRGALRDAAAPATRRATATASTRSSPRPTTRSRPAAAPDGLPVFADGLRAARITDAVLTSAREERWVELTSPVERAGVKPSESARSRSRIVVTASRSSRPSGSVPKRSPLRIGVAVGRDLAAAGRDRRQRRAPVALVRLARDEAGALEPVDDVGHRRPVHLQPVAHLAQRQRAAAAVVEEHQRLVAREGQVERLELVVEPREQDLLDAHDRGDGAHRRDRLVAPVGAPVPPRLGDGVEVGHARARQPRTASGASARAAGPARSTFSGARTCSMTITAAPITPARTPSRVLPMRRSRVAIGSERPIAASRTPASNCWGASARSPPMTIAPGLKKLMHSASTSPTARPGVADGLQRERLARARVRDDVAAGARRAGRRRSGSPPARRRRRPPPGSRCCRRCRARRRDRRGARGRCRPRRRGRRGGPAGRRRSRSRCVWPTVT